MKFMTVKLAQIPVISEGDTEVGVVDFTDKLDSSELLTGTPTVVESGTSALTLGNKQVNAATVVTEWATVAIGKAVLFSVSGQFPGVIYELIVTASTDATIARTLRRIVKFSVE